jgi:hypothetical protein
MNEAFDIEVNGFAVYRINSGDCFAGRKELR